MVDLLNNLPINSKRKLLEQLREHVGPEAPLSVPQIWTRLYLIILAAVVRGEASGDLPAGSVEHWKVKDAEFQSLLRSDPAAAHSFAIQAGRALQPIMREQYEQRQRTS